MIELIQKNLEEHECVFQENRDNIFEKSELFAKLISDSLKNGGCIFWCGNGGSASDAQHMAGELLGRFKSNRKPLKSLALSADTSVITCISNDFGFDQLFSRQLEGLAHKNDVLVGISTSGNSKNVLLAVTQAKKMGVTTLALLGNDGGLIREQVDYSVVIKSKSTARIQEMHIMIGHILCDLIEKNLELS